MTGRAAQTKAMTDALKAKRSTFAAITGRRRVGKTYLIREVYKDHMCYSITGIQHADIQTQINNFMLKLAEYSNTSIIVGEVSNWQQAFIAFE